MRLAGTSKRLDVCAAQIAHVLHLAKIESLEGKACLELGAGSVLSHALVFHVLGARDVLATDVVAMAHSAGLERSVKLSTLSIIRDILSPFADHESLRARLDRLAAWDDFTLSGLERLGISYRAPIDFSKSAPQARFDFVYSNSVLEHVPPADLPGLLSNIASCVGPGGSMFHGVHLEDHRDHAGRPFDFLSLPTEKYPVEACYSRGNRVRASEWKRLFSSLPGFDTNLLYQWRRPADLLPSRVDPSLPNAGPDDLRTGHLGIFSRRIG